MSESVLFLPDTFILPQTDQELLKTIVRQPSFEKTREIHVAVRRRTWLNWARRSFRARLLDLRATGARLASDSFFRPGEYLKIEMTAPYSDIQTRDLPEPVHRTVQARVIREREVRAGHGTEYDLEFVNTRSQRLHAALDRCVPWLALLASVLVMCNVAALKGFNFYYFWYQPIINLYSILVSGYILSRIVIAGFYSPPRDTGYRPPVSVIVACKNEESGIGRTIERIYQADYPWDRLEVIAVDDGSTDGTLAEMNRVKGAYPDLKVISFPKNRGKRHAMAAGSQVATGDVLVFVDSDTLLRRDAITRLACCFVDPEIGAVCGHADVTNAKANFLTKMQQVRYYIAFRVLKAAESAFSAVTCCSGCLAAYRRQYVMEILDHWSRQRFMGVPATFGDDRSLTNYMLRRFRVIYHSEAVASTAVPERLRQFLKQQLRWKKSWVRESLIACTFLWKRHPLAAFFFYMGVIFPLIAPVIVFHSVVMPWFGFGSFSLLYVYGSVLMSILYGLLYLVSHRNSMWLYGIAFSVFYMLFLVWQTYYALVTVRKNHWGTR
jgi:hyaluronan synthase